MQNHVTECRSFSPLSQQRSDTFYSYIFHSVRFISKIVSKPHSPVKSPRSFLMLSKEYSTP